MEIGTKEPMSLMFSPNLKKKKRGGGFEDSGWNKTVLLKARFLQFLCATIVFPSDSKG